MDNLKDVYIACVAFTAAFLYWVGNYDKDKELGKWAKVRKLTYGGIGASISCRLVFESLFYFGLPFRLCLAIASFVAYLGGDFVANLVVKLIDKKIEKM